jgi:DNA polymerase-3 subunit gamma/tau
LQAVPDAGDESDPDAATVARLAPLLGADETQLLYSIVIHGRAELGLAPDEYSGLVMVLLRWLAFRPSSVGSQPKPAGRVVPREVIREPAQAAAVAPAPAMRVPVLVAKAVANEPPPWVDEPAYDDEPLEVDPPVPNAMAVAELARPLVSAAGLPRPLVTTAFGDRWAEVVRRLAEAGSITALVRELAMQAQCIAIDESAAPMRWTLRVEREMLRAPAHRDKLQAALAEALGHAVQLDTEAGIAEDSPARRDAAERARRQGEAEQIIHDDPLVQALMQQYKSARIVPGSVKFH